MAKEREEETLVEEVEEVETWVERISQFLLFLASTLTVPAGFFEVSFGYPYLLARSWVVEVG